MLCFLVSCAGLQPELMNNSGNSGSQNQLIDAFTVPSVVVDSDRIKSVELYRIRRGNVPVIRLTSSDALTLRFDEIANETNIFRVRITHHDADWKESTVIPNFFQTGFSEDTISSGTPSVISGMSYFSYSYSFPNRDFGVRISGNYMIHVVDYVTGETLLSMPFIVSEDRGALTVAVEDIYDFRAIPHHQLFATYRYPDFILMPQTDLSFHFVQNQHWGRFVEATESDASTQGEIRKHPLRDDAFFSRYEFRPLDIPNIQSLGGRDILEVIPEADPPLVRLNYDVVDLDVNPRLNRSYRFGEPTDDRSARYVNVEFNLERPQWIASESEIYVIGPFTNWQVKEAFKMDYLRDEDAFRATGLIKEGRYDYTYVMIENNRVNDIKLNAFFADNRQFYQVIIYYHDRQQGYDRVLQFSDFQY